MTGGTIQGYVARRRRSRRAWIAYAIPVLFLALRAVFEFAFDGLTGKIVSGLNDVLGDARIDMAIAGWLTIAFLPLAVDVFVRDRQRRLGDVAIPTSDTGVIHMTTRVKAESGHGLAPRSIAHWIRRTPTLLAFTLAVLFWPLTGAAMTSRWTSTAGGLAFSHGWRISLVAAALGILVVLAEPWLRASSRRYRLALYVLPVVALAAALIVR